MNEIELLELVRRIEEEDYIPTNFEVRELAACFRLAINALREESGDHERTRAAEVFHRKAAESKMRNE